jgi:hypothetical protein
LDGCIQLEAVGKVEYLRPMLSLLPR